MTRHGIKAVLVAMVLAGFGVAAVSGPSTGSATQPAEVRINRLVAQLGEEDFQARLRAGEELLAIGRAALPALREGAKSTDPEIQTRSESLIKEIEKPREAPAARGGRRRVEEMLPGPMEMQQEFRVDVGVGAGRTVTIRRNNRTTSLVENAGGVALTVTEPDADGKMQTREYKAKNAEELKKEHPEVAGIYDELSRRNQVNMIRPGMPRGLQQMLKDRRAQLKGLPLASITPNLEKLGLEVEEATEAMKAQLGEGVVVSGVEGGWRGEKIGLREHDLIQKVNDKGITTVDDLERAVEGEDPLTLEILRAGKRVRLEEKKAE